MAETANVALLVKEVHQTKRMPFVHPDHWFSCVLQMGSNCRWRKYGPGHWVRDKENDTEDMQERLIKAWRHVPAIHEVESITGKTLNGLIQRHNDWVKASIDTKGPEGDEWRMLIDRQLLVLKYGETTVEPEELQRNNRNGSVSERTIKAIASEVAAATVNKQAAPPALDIDTIKIIVAEAATQAAVAAVKAFKKEK